MKSIKEKARAYDEAIKKAAALYKASEPMSGCNVIIGTLFPGLKESEDEKARQKILFLFYAWRNNEQVNIPNKKEVEKAIAWLEKQEGCEYIKKDWLEHIKQSWYKEGFIDGKYSGGTSKEWTINDAATLKELIDFLENGTAKLQHDLTRYANWLKNQFTPIEKQGEQKASYTTIAETGNGGINALVTLPIEMKTAEESLGVDSKTYNKIVDECIFDEQNDSCVKDYNNIDPHFGKSIDKTEPKFHEGEWITNGDYTWKIVEVKPLDYILQSQDGNVVDDTISHVDEQFHSFTIEDAKDGDVLVCNINKAEIGGDIEKLPNITPTICVYQNVVKDKDYIHTYFSLYNGSSLVLSNSMYYNTFVYNIHPATKKQRNLLFQKMKEAGYEWDDEKKELKKISQRMVSAEAKEALYDKHTWSEEDEKIMNGLIDSLTRISLNTRTDSTSPNYTFYKEIDWLKSLRPQNHWKPSDEQMWCLSDAIEHYNSLGYPAPKLKELYEQLKKL